MEVTEYKDFSLKLHRKSWKNNFPLGAQFELTFGCNLHCAYCYTESYNNQSYIKEELDTEQIYEILDKLKKENILWLCLTGGDPLFRDDFVDIYKYAQKKGFITTVFTNGTLINTKILEVFKKFPPFCIEITLNAITETTYEKITKVKDTYKKALYAIDILLKNNIPLKIKTYATVLNYNEMRDIKKFVEKRNLKFRLSTLLYPRLNGDLFPISLRLSVEKLIELKNNLGYNIKACGRGKPKLTDRLYQCFSNQDSFFISPSGEMYLCHLTRKYSVNILKDSIKNNFKKLLNRFQNQTFKTNSKCKICSNRSICNWCPPRAELETGNKEEPISYFCELFKAEERFFRRRDYYEKKEKI